MVSPLRCSSFIVKHKCDFRIFMALKQRLAEQDVIGNVAVMRHNSFTFTSVLVHLVYDVMEMSTSPCCAVSCCPDCSQCQRCIPSIPSGGLPLATTGSVPHTGCSSVLLSPSKLSH